jgi:citrate lyase subunit beta / citryl-CoA lyase
MKLRSVLFAPASNPEMALKLPRSGPDAVVIDLEDALPPSQKARARSDASMVVGQLRSAHPTLPIFVRVNALATQWFQEDVRALDPWITGVMVPKIESTDDVIAVSEALTHLTGRAWPLFVGLETVRGVRRCDEIAAAHNVIAVYFGAEDYIADLGGVRTPLGLEVLIARTNVAVAARMAGIAALDQIVPSINDVDQFAADSAVGRSLGYRGKLCIHPSQVALANAAFSPSEQELDRAHRLLAAYQEAQHGGRGVVTFEGLMIDEPLVTQARNVIASGQ